MVRIILLKGVEIDMDAWAIACEWQGTSKLCRLITLAFNKLTMHLWRLGVV